MLNKVILMGRFTRDPEMRYTQNNTPVTSFTLAVNRDRKGANGEQVGDFIDCISWSKQGEFVKQWFTKGMLAVVVGRLQSRSYEDKNGNRRTVIEVVTEDVSFGETKKAREGNNSMSNSGYDDFTKLDDDDGNVPF